MIKKIILVISILLILSVKTASAQENVTNILTESERRKGSVQIVLTDEEKELKKENIGFQCIKVADIVDGEYIFENAVLFDSNKTADDITSEERDEIARKLSELEYISEVKFNDQNGTIMFNELVTGVYLLKEVSDMDDKEILPTLIAVPTWEDSEQKMEYDLTVFPKYTEIIKENVKTGDIEYKISLYAGTAILSAMCIICFNRKRKSYDEKSESNDQ